MSDIDPFITVVGQGESTSIVEGILIPGNSRITRALSILGQRPPFNGDPRVEELDFKDLMEAQNQAVDASGISEIVYDLFDTLRPKPLCIIVGKLGVMSLTATEEFIDDQLVFSDKGLRLAVEEITGPYSASFYPTKEVN